MHPRAQTTRVTAPLDGRSQRSAPPALALLALIVGALYLLWRWSSTRAGVHPALFYGLWLGEVSLWVRLALRTRVTWDSRTTRAPALSRYRSTDLVVVSYAEPVEVVRASLIGCRSVQHPHETWLVDEGHRPELRLLAEELGVRYVARAETTGARTGAINHVLRTSTAELIMILDGDQVPMPDALHQVGGYFDQPDIALVQTPVEYANRDSLLHSDHARHERSLHNEVLSPARDLAGAALWEGPAAVLRREALVGIGGVPTSGTTGELQATVRLHGAKWRTRFHPTPVVQGSAPHNLDAFLAQRARWARGHLAILPSRDNPLIAPGLRARQRLSHLDLIAEYLAAPFQLAMLMVLAVTLLTGSLPLQADHRVLVPFAGIWLVTASMGWWNLGRGRTAVRETAMKSAVTLEIHLAAFVSALFGIRRRFNPVARTGVDVGGYDVVKRLPLLALVTVTLEAALAARLLDALIGWPLPNKLGGMDLVIAAGVAGATLLFALRVLGVFVQRKQLRSSYREGVDFGGLVDGRLVKVTDLSIAGFGFVSPTIARTGETINVQLRLPMADGSVRDIEFVALVRSALPNQHGSRWRIGAQIVGGTPQTRDTLIEYVSVVRPFQRLRTQRPDDRRGRTSLSASRG